MEIPSLVHDVNVESQVVNNKGNLKQQKKFQCWFAKDTLLDWKKNNDLEELKDFSLNGNISEHRSQWYQNWHHTDDKNNSQMDLLSMWWVSVTCSKLLKKKHCWKTSVRSVSISPDSFIIEADDNDIGDDYSLLCRI